MSYVNEANKRMANGDVQVRCLLLGSVPGQALAMLVAWLPGRAPTALPVVHVEQPHKLHCSSDPAAGHPVRPPDPQFRFVIDINKSLAM